MNKEPIMGYGGMPKGGGVPEGWEIYSNIGQVVKGTRFVPFKVPLNEDLLNKVPEGVDRNWGLKHLKLACPKLVLIVDVTNTNRYYSGQQAEQMGFKYVKIMTKGHEVPDNQVVMKFYNAVREVLEEDKEGIVGVHCTHGLNRTGYLICRYMVEKLSMEPDVAIKVFNTARGHVQQRANFLEHLRGRIWEKTNIHHDNIESQDEPMTYGQYKRINERQNPYSDTQSYSSVAVDRESHHHNNHNQYDGTSYSYSSKHGHPYKDEWQEQFKGRYGHINRHREGASSCQWNNRYNRPHYGNRTRNDSSLDHKNLHGSSNRNEENSEYRNSHGDILDEFNSNHYKLKQQMTKEDTARIQAANTKTNDGKTDKDSFPARAQAAADRKTRK